MKLKIKNFTKNFPNKKLFTNQNVELEIGITGIIGKNGSGKTTLLKSIAGLAEIESGDYFLDDRKIDTESDFWKSLIGYLPQFPNLYEKMTVFDFLKYMLLLSEKKKNIENRIDHYLERFYITEFKNIAIGNLSGGIKQRVGIIQAFIHNPKIILLDEPSNNLDYESRKLLNDFLKEESSEKIIIIIGHILTELLEISKEILHINCGIEKIKPTELKIKFEPYCFEYLFDSLQDYEKEKHNLKVVSENIEEDKISIRYDSRFSNFSLGNNVTPTNDEALKILMN